MFENPALNIKASQHSERQRLEAILDSQVEKYCKIIVKFFKTQPFTSTAVFMPAHWAFQAQKINLTETAYRKALAKHDLELVSIDYHDDSILVSECYRLVICLGNVSGKYNDPKGPKGPDGLEDLLVVDHVGKVTKKLKTTTFFSSSQTTPTPSTTLSGYGTAINMLVPAGHGMTLPCNVQAIN